MDQRGDHGLGRIAAAQRGLAHRSQLVGVGIGRGSIAHRLAAGSLHRILPSVLAVGNPALQPWAFETAALLSCGADAVLSHGTAAALWGLIPTAPDEVSVTLIRRHVRQPPGLRIHRVRHLDVRDAGFRNCLPVTGPARTLIDFAAVCGRAALAAAVNEARVLRLVTDVQLEQAMERCPGRAGVSRLRALLRAERGPALTRSDAERDLRLIIERAELPWPQFNVWLHGHLADALWPEAKLVVEIDGYRVHGHRAAFERDRRRDQRLAAEGYVVLRVTWRQLRAEPLAVVARLAQALARRRDGGESPPGAETAA